MKVLLIEDSPEIVETVTMVFQLRWPEASVLTTIHGEKGIELARNESPNIIILDLGLPDIDGFQVLRRLREFTDIPVIILTVRGDETNKIRGLELGADDYVVKPFSPGELLARVRAVTRRLEPAEAKSESVRNLIMFGRLRVDLETKEVAIGDKSLKLSPRAFDLLNQLVIGKGEFVPAETLMKAVAIPGEELNPNLVAFLVKTLNRELGEGTGISEMIVREPDKGYKLSTR